MNSSTEAREIATQAIPIITAWLENSEQLRALGKVATDKGFSWIGIRSYLKAQILDGNDGGDRVAKLLEKKGDELAIAEMLGGAIKKEDAA